MADDDASAPRVQNYEQLLWLVSHELRNPLSVAGGYLRMLLRDTQLPISDRHRKMVEEAERACRTMIALVSELNDIRKLDAGGAGLTLESFNLLDVLRKAEAEATEAVDRGVRFSISADGQEVPVRGDRMRLHTAFAALFRTVLREQQDSTVVVADCRLTRQDGHRSVLIVVAREERLAAATCAAPAVFDETRGGIGLALPIARRIIEQHGGRVWSPAGEDGIATARSAVIMTLPLVD